MSAAAQRPRVWVLLLRGINVGGHKKLPMADLRRLATALGWEDVQTYIQSGNLVCRAPGDGPTLAAALERTLRDELAFEAPIVAVERRVWARLAEGGVFPDAEVEHPKGLHVGLAQGAKPSAANLKALAPYCQQGERIAVNGGALWIDFPAGVAGTKLTPAVLDRTVGAPITMRNWNTVQAIEALLAAL